MTKKKSLLLTTLLLVFTLALSCVFFTACEPTPENRTITWEYDSNVLTVAAKDYETLPTELAEGTEITFTVTAEEGYEVGSVSGGAKKQEDGSYKLTVGKTNITVKINNNKILNSIEVTKMPDTLIFFEDQEIDKTAFEVTAHYALGDEVITNYNVSYQGGKSAFSVGDTSFTISFGGKEVVIELDEEVQAQQTFVSAELTLENDTPVLIVTGFYTAGGDAATAKATVEGYFAKVTERGSWSNKEFTAEATIAQDNSFVVKLTLLETTAGNQYYFHIRDGADGQDFTCPLIVNESAAMGPSNDNITAEITGEPVVATDGTKYYIGYCQDWGSKAIMIYVVNESAPQFVSVGLEVKDGKPYAVFNGTATVTTTVEDLETTLLNLVNHLDMEDISNGNAKLTDFIHESAIVLDDNDSPKAFFEIDTETNTFKLYCLLEGTGIVDGANFFAHLGPQGSGGYYPNVGFPSVGESITCNGFTFSFTTAEAIGVGGTDSSVSWQNSLTYINVSAVA